MRTLLPAVVLGAVLGHPGTPAGSTAVIREPRGSWTGAFVPNVGQWSPAVRYSAQLGGVNVFLHADGWTMTAVDGHGAGPSAPSRGVAVRMRVVGAGAATLVPERCLPGVHHYFLGNEPERWRTGVPRYAAVRYLGLRPGVDMVARQQDGHFEYDLLLGPAAELGELEIAVEGVDGMRLGDDGALVFDTPLGPVRMAAPPSWQEGPAGELVPIACGYVLRGEHRFGFAAPGRRSDWSLVIDPGLVWSSFCGGGAVPFAVALDAQGAVTMTGRAWSDLRATPGAFDPTFNGGSDAFVARLSPDGSSLVFATFLGGTGYDLGLALALDAQGAATIAGHTDSDNFATTAGAFDPVHNGATDAFVARLSRDGASLVYSTYLGGSAYVYLGTGNDEARGVAVDAQGAATVVGMTDSADFPTTPGALSTTFAGGNPPFYPDAFVARLSPNGSSLVYSTYLGGARADRAWAVAIDARGDATVAGTTESTDFPTTAGAFDRTANGAADAFVARLSPGGSSLVHGTYLGGTGDDLAFAVAVDASGGTVVAGVTQSTGFPTTTGAWDRTLGGFEDAFVARLAPDGSGLDDSTFLGGASHDRVFGLALDPRGAAVVAGQSFSVDFPVTAGAFDERHNGNSDAFVARLSPSGSGLEYSSYLGGAQHDHARAVALDARGAATVVGESWSPGFPTTAGVFAPALVGGADGFVTRMDLLPAGVAAFGASTPGCAGPLASSVTSIPQVGNAAFALTCGNAPPFTNGYLIAGSAGLVPPSAPLRVAGAELWVDPNGSLFVIAGAVGANQIGGVDLPLPIPMDVALRGAELFTQFVWLGPTAPPPCPPLGVSASNALRITVQ